jgi:hypothetical protein
VNLTYNILAEQWEYLWLVKTNSWLEGPYNLTIRVEDWAGNYNESTMNTRVDYTPPELFILIPTNNSIISGAVPIQVNINDQISGLTNISIKINNNSPENMTKILPNVYQYLFISTSFADGPVNFTFSASNNANLINQSTVFFTIDNTLPTVLLGGNLTIKGEQAFVLTCADASGFSRIAWQIDAKPLNELARQSLQTFKIFSSKYSDGFHNLTIIVQDNAIPTNTRIIVYNITIDNTDPQVAVRNLKYDDVIPANYIIKIDVYDKTTCRIYYSIDRGNYSELVKNENQSSWYLSIAALNLTEGTHYLSIRGVDIAGNVDTDEYKFVVVPVPEFPWFWIAIGGALGAAAIVSIFVIRGSKKKNKAGSTKSDKKPKEKPTDDKNKNVKSDSDKVDKAKLEKAAKEKAEKAKLEKAEKEKSAKSKDPKKK